MTSDKSDEASIAAYYPYPFLIVDSKTLNNLIVDNSTKSIKYLIVDNLMSSKRTFIYDSQAGLIFGDGLMNSIDFKAKDLRSVAKSIK